MIKAKIEIGAMDITFEAQNMKDVFKFSGVYGNLPKKCHVCESDKLMLDHRSPKGFDYYALKCTDCGASGNFGQAKEGGALFWKYDTQLEHYQPTEPVPGSTPVDRSGVPQASSEDKLLF